MIKIKISIAIPQLWKQDVFSKESWNDVDFIVGPNGTGKSLFAEKLNEIGNGASERQNVRTWQS